METGPVERDVQVRVPQERAFVTFVQQFSKWWPAEYTFAQSALDAIFVEPRKGGRCVERNKKGEETVWGHVLEWDPPSRLLFSWQMTPDRRVEPDPAKASEVEVRFVAEGPTKTRVTLVHRGFERHGPGAETLRAGMDSPQGWMFILQRYEEALR